METKKILVACFIGGMVCATVALLVNPTFWWFGLMAGFAAGYVAYEFREVLKAVPIAMRFAIKGGFDTYRIVVSSAKAWLSKPHPFYYPAAIAVTPLFVWVAYHVISFSNQVFAKGPIFVVILIAPIFYAEVVFGFLLMMWLAVIPLFTFAFIGARLGEHCYWQPFISAENDAEEIEKLNKRGYHEGSLTYWSVMRWFLKGISLTIKFFLWTMWKYAIVYAWKSACFIRRFIWQMVKLIHSYERVLCAVDGTLGGATSYGLFRLTHVGSATLAEYLMFVIFGGLIGAVIGVLNYEVVSKRILRLVAITK